MERWQIEVELTTDIIPDETPQQAQYRIKEALEKIRGEGKELAHYHILKAPTKMEDF